MLRSDHKGTQFVGLSDSFTVVGLCDILLAHVAQCSEPQQVYEGYLKSFDGYHLSLE
jgi:hypothetical protein